jgi:hypothetical protein
VLDTHPEWNVDMKLDPNKYDRTDVLASEAAHVINGLQSLRQQDGSYRLREHGDEVEVDHSPGEDLPFRLFHGYDPDGDEVIVFYSCDGARIWLAI